MLDGKVFKSSTSTPLRAGPGDVVLQLRPILADEIVGLLDHHQPPAAAEHGDRRKLLDHVGQIGVLPLEGGQRELRFVAAQHGFAQTDQRLTTQERLVAKDRADRLRRMLLRLGEVIDRWRVLAAMRSIPWI